MQKIAIIDYGVGNLFSLASSLRHLGVANSVTRDAEEIRAADRIILPGVGAFGDAMAKLRDTGLIPVLDEQAAAGKPLLGICLGMQMLLEKSYEYGEHAGLGYIHGEVRPLAEAIRLAGLSLKVPHMGWNSLRIARPHPILQYTKPGCYVYFVHSYYATDCGDALVADTGYTAPGTDRGVAVPAIVAAGNVVGCQFHPEKSGTVGLDMLRAFAEM